MRLPNLPSPQQGIDKMRDQISNAKQSAEVTKLKLQTRGFPRQDAAKALSGDPNLSGLGKKLLDGAHQAKGKAKETAKEGAERSFKALGRMSDSMSNMMGMSRDLSRPRF